MMHGHMNIKLVSNLDPDRYEEGAMTKLMEILNTDLPPGVLKTKGPKCNRNIRHICGIAEQLDYSECQQQIYILGASTNKSHSISCSRPNFLN